MSFLTPLFLLGLIGVGLPIWLHRLQTQTNEREKFASAMFLEQTRHRIHVQKKLKYLLLMALRILFLVLLVLAFIRPVWELPVNALLGDNDTLHVIVIDSSFSMQQGDHFDQALDRARDIIDDMDSDDQASIYSASSTVTTVSDPSEDAAVLRQSLSGLEAGNGRLDIGAMVSALNTLMPRGEANVMLHVISDFQRSGQPIRFADMIPDVINDRPVQLSLERIASVNLPNWAVTSVITGIDDATVIVQGTNTQAAEISVSLSVNGVVQGEVTRTVPANGQQIFLFENLIFETGDNRLDAQILENDTLVTDDHRFTVLDNSPPAPVLLLTSNPQSLSITYLRAALATAPRPYEAEVQIMNDLDPRIMARFPWVIVDDIGSVNESLATAISDYISGGGAVFATMGERSESLQTVPVSGQTLSGSTNLSNGNGRRIITSIDSSHQALRDSNGWATVNITQALPLQPAESDVVLMSLNNNVPLLMERQIGLGKFMLLNSALDNTWADLPLKPVFVGFMAEIARYLSGESILQREQTVNSYLQLQASGGASGQVYAPDGSTLLSLADTASAREVQLTELGYYRVITPAGEVLVAVNPDLRESDLTVMETQTLQSWENSVAGAPGTVNTQLGSAATVAAEPEQLELWRVLLILLVVIVIAESLFGNRHLRFQTDTPLTTSSGPDTPSAQPAGAHT